MATASEPIRIQTHTGMEPLSSSPAPSFELPAAALLAGLSFPLTSCLSLSLKETFVPSTVPPSAWVTLPGKVTDWEMSAELSSSMLSKFSV